MTKQKIQIDLETLEKEYKGRFSTLLKNYLTDKLITFDECLELMAHLNQTYEKEKDLIWQKGEFYEVKEA